MNPDAKVLCGQFEIHWDDLVAALMMWKKELDIAPLHQRAFLKAMHLAEFRDRFSVKKEPISLLNAMRWSHQTMATDPRDKIFGLLGLCHDGDTLVPLPNYKQPLEEIITDMSKRMMSLNRSLDLMCFKGTSLSNTKLPSWTPNWMNLWSGSFNSMTIHEMKFLDRHSIFPFDPVLEGSAGQILKVKGKQSGRVCQLSSELTQLSSDGRLNLSIGPPAHWITSTSSLAEKHPPLDKAKEDDLTTRNTIWQTLTMGLLPPEMTAEAAAFCFSKLWTPEGRGAVHNLALIDWIDRNAWLSYGNWTLWEWSQMKAPPSSPPASSNVGSGQFLGGDRSQSKNQRIAETHKTENTVEQLIAFIDTLEHILKSGMRLAVVSGHGTLGKDYIGMVLSNARTSDQVWHIRGCSVPILLRKIDRIDCQTRHEVIGAMYLHDAKKWFGLEEKWIRGEEGHSALVRIPEVLNLC